MPQRPSRFGFTVTAVTLIHGVLLVLLVAAGTRSCVSRKPPPTVMPIEFIVAVDDGPEIKEPLPPKPEASPVKPDVVPPKPPEPEIKEPDPIPMPVKKPTPAKKPNPVKKPTSVKKPDPVKKATTVKKPIERGRRISAPNPTPPPPNFKKLSQEEIARLLALGATPGNRNTIPEGDTLAFEVIRRKLYQAWTQPASVPRNLTAVVEIHMNASGDVLARRLIRGSGNAVMDQTVMEAVQAVRRIEGLSADFLNRWRKVSITFELAAGAG